MVVVKNYRTTSQEVMIMWCSYSKEVPL